MRLGNRLSEPPARREKAVFSRTSTLDKFAGELNESVRHWRGQYERAARLGNAVLYSTSTAMLEYIRGSMEVWNTVGLKVNEPGNAIIVEQARRTALSALGVSMLLRMELPDGEFADDAEATGPDNQLGTINDMIVDIRSWKDFRVHVPIGVPGVMIEGQGSQWYRDGDLYVHQARPAEPTDWLKDEFLPGLGIPEPDFSGHETLFPYVAAR